ncbi:hypothetical protein [Castellaniella sp.]|uniref:hypothetical protein n=1 Tax=Castellaniella sp. TaxID=1955812 RepID=UPI002AFFEE03|nr:hypothetical protein [Castellaniella sp.]
MSDHNYDAEPDLASLAATMRLPASDPNIGKIARQCKSFVRDLHRFNAIRVAAAFGGLLLQPSLQANCLRLETLVHLSVAFGQGIEAPGSKILLKGFSALGLACGHLEDPPESIFVGNISSSRGNYLVLEGVWESATFYLQRIVEMVDELPDEPQFQFIANSIHALLKISDFALRRAGLKRNQSGEETRTKVLPKSLAQQFGQLQDLVRFSHADLADAGVDIDLLGPFLLGQERAGLLRDQTVGHSELERRPIVWSEQSLFLVLPTAVTVAIRRFFIEVLGMDENRQVFLSSLTRQYATLLAHSPLLGSQGRKLPFRINHIGSLCCAAREVDAGRHLALVCIVDTLEDFKEDGFRGAFVPTKEQSDQIDKAIAFVLTACSRTEGFQQGLLLVLTCGIGRGASLSLLPAPDPRWKVQHTSTADFWTLGWLPDMDVLQLWRILLAQDQLARMGVQLQNANGLLNLVAWADSNKGHLVPHSDIPSEAARKKLCLAITQNAILEARRSFHADVDMHAERFIDGRWILVQIDGRSHFDDENRQPLYRTVDPAEDGFPMGMCRTAARAWWFQLPVHEGKPSWTYERWRMLETWCRRAAPHLEAEFSTYLGNGAILWKCIFTSSQIPLDPEQGWGNAEDAAHAIAVTAEHATCTIQMTIGSAFERALYSPENIAEAALVRALISGVSRLSDRVPSDPEGLFRKIVPSAQARQTHMFSQQEFRDFFPWLGRETLVNISSYEDAATRLGLGWKVRDPREGGAVAGKEACRQFLNDLVRRVEDELRVQLAQFDRRDVLSKVSLNYEAASVSRARWHRTSSAILALRDDQSSALSVMKEQEFKLNAIFHGSRVLLEMAICECPLNGARELGRMDHSLLLTLASQIHHLGGWSDLIHWGLMKPAISVRALGDVHVHHDFIDSVIDQFGSRTNAVRYMDSVRSYSKNLAMPAVVLDVKGVLDQKFLDAWVVEFGFEFNALRQFVDAVENHGIERDEPIFVIRRSELEALAPNKGIGPNILAALSLQPRTSWRDLPEGHDDRDISFWRFRRRLSFLRRPLLQLSNDEDPEMFVAPAMLREGVISTLANYYSGSYADRHLGPAMRRYAGHARHRDGMQFNERVTKRMNSLGWRTHSEIALSKLLSSKLERNYGDVDVLAWDPKNGRVLVMECKDLQFRKTYGEIAEQLMDFAGEVDEKGRRDLLRKHLDRVELLQIHASTVARYLGLSNDCTIESHLVFKNPVPMQFAEGPIRTHCIQHTFDSLSELNLGSHVEAATDS